MYPAINPIFTQSHPGIGSGVLLFASHRKNERTKTDHLILIRSLSGNGVSDTVHDIDNRPNSIPDLFAPSLLFETLAGWAGSCTVICPTRLHAFLPLSSVSMPPRTHPQRFPRQNITRDTMTNPNYEVIRCRSSLLIGLATFHALGQNASPY